MIAATTSTRTAAAGLLAIAGLHVIWATRSAWPLPDQQGLIDAVVGTEDGTAPSSGACLAVAGLLGLAAAFVDGHPRRVPAISRIGAAGVVATLATRGAFGLAGRTDLLVPGSASERFRRLDRRVYAPLCLSLAASALPAALNRR